tara:strand:+ start:12504 stop:12914 length:411 start_codon:yes stop_codon:yes gene_type:complete
MLTVVSMEKRGRKIITIGTKEISKVELLAARGLLDKEIMVMMGWSHDTFYKKKKLHSELSDAIERGRATGHAAVANKLFDACMSSNIGAIQFYLARRAGWVEPKGDSGDQNDEVPSLNVSFNINEPVAEIKVTKGV